jgi:hypothetical protein
MDEIVLSEITTKDGYAGLLEEIFFNPVGIYSETVNHCGGRYEKGNVGYGCGPVIRRGGGSGRLREQG